MYSPVISPLRKEIQPCLSLERGLMYRLYNGIKENVTGTCFPHKNPYKFHLAVYTEINRTLSVSRQIASRFLS